MESKICFKCNVEKDVSEFYKNRRNSCGLASYCKPCQAANQRRWRASNAEKANKSEQRRREIRNRTAKEWRENNPDRWSALLGKTAATRRQQDCIPDDFDFEKTIPFYAERDRLNAMGDVRYEVDHIIPLTKGGKHHHDNLQVITQKENRAKGNTIMTYEHSQHLFLFPENKVDSALLFDEVAENAKDVVDETQDQHILDRALEKQNLTKLVVTEDKIEYHFN